MKRSYHEEGNDKVHTLSIYFILHSSDFIEDNSSLTTINNEHESSEDNTTENESETSLTHKVQHSFSHICLEILC